MENRYYNNSKFQPPLPNATGVLVLGIISIVLFCCCYGVIGLTCAIISLIMANRAIKLYDLYPEEFSISSFNNVKSGKICAIIGLCISGLYFLIMIVFIIIYGFVFLSALGPSMLDKL